MNEMTFMTIAATEVANSTNERLQSLYKWSREIFRTLNYCNDDAHLQSIHAATVAADLLLRIKTIEDTGETMDPHYVDTLLTDKETIAPKFYYRNSDTEVTLDISIYDIKSGRQIGIPVLVVPLVLPITVLEKSEASIVVPT